MLESEVCTTLPSYIFSLLTGDYVGLEGPVTFNLLQVQPQSCPLPEGPTLCAIWYTPGLRDVWSLASAYCF